MKISAKTCCTMLAGVVLAAATQAAMADQILNFQLNLPGGPLDLNLNQLGFNGDSYIVNTSNGSGGFNFVDTGVFNVTTKNGGPNLPLGGGQLTFYYHGATGTAIPGGDLSFNDGGLLDIYYSPTVTYGASAANVYGATSGTKIATMTQLAGNSGSTVNPDGTPAANGQLSLLFRATYLAAGVWNDSTGAALPTNFTLGFVTSNASEDLSASCTVPANCTIDPNLVTALGGSIPNAPPDNFFVNNGGQLKLEAVPEPSTIALLGLGFAALTVIRRRRA